MIDEVSIRGVLRFGELASENLELVFEFGFVVVSMVSAASLLQALTLPAVLIGNLLAAGAMAAYFWRRHPALSILP